MDLENTFAEEKRVEVDTTLANLDEKHMQERDDLRAKHEAALKALEGIHIYKLCKCQQ